MAARDIQSNYDRALAYGDINQSMINQGYSPQFGAGGSQIASGILPSYTRTTTYQSGASPQAMPSGQADRISQLRQIQSQIPQNRSQSLLQSAYEQVMGRASGAPDGQYQGGTQGLTKGGFYGSMPALEAASMRLADAALGREMLAGEYKGSQETGLQQLRGSQEYGLAQLTGGQQAKLQSSRLQAESAAAKFQQRNQIDSEIRALQLERQRVGATTRSNESVWLYNSLGNQIRELERQRNAIR